MKKRIIRLVNIMTIALSLGLLLTACGGASADANGTLTRASYIGMLGDTFGYNDPSAESAIFSDVSSNNEFYNQVQACAEWEVISNENNFEPDKKATTGFVLESAVKAIGLNKVPEAGTTTEELAGFFAQNIAQIDISDLNKSVDAVTAQQIVDCALEYRNNIELPQVCEIELADKVKESKSDIILKGDGSSGTFLGATDYQVGDIIYIPATTESVAYGIRISTIDGDNFTYTDAAPEEVFSTLKMSGTYEGVVVGATNPMTGVDVAYANEDEDGIPNYILACSLLDTDKEEAVLSDCMDAEDAEMLNTKASVDKGKGYVIYNVDWDGTYETENGTASSHADLSIGIENIKVTLDYDLAFLSLKSADVRVNFDTFVRSSVEGHVSTTIPLGKVIVNCGGLPCNVELSLTANLGADGSISVDYTANMVASIAYAKNKGLSKNLTCDSNLDVHAEVTLTAEATALISFEVLGASLANAQITTGVVGVATMDASILDDKTPTCIDLYVYVPLRWGVNQKSCLITKVSDKLKYSATIWDSSNSPFNWRWHFEDLKEVPECTRGKGEEVETPVVDEDGNPYEEYKLFEFEPLDFGFIDVESYTMFLKSGETLKIKVTDLPQGYTEADLVYSSEDTKVCTVDGSGNIKGVNGGSTVVKVATNDGSFEVAIMVTVAVDYDSNIDGGFQSL